MAPSPKKDSILPVMLIVAGCWSAFRRSAEMQSVLRVVASPLWSSETIRNVERVGRLGLNTISDRRQHGPN